MWAIVAPARPAASQIRHRPAGGQRSTSRHRRRKGQQNQEIRGQIFSDPRLPIRRKPLRRPNQLHPRGSTQLPLSRLPSSSTKAFRALHPRPHALSCTAAPLCLPFSPYTLRRESLLPVASLAYLWSELIAQSMEIVGDKDPSSSLCHSSSGQKIERALGHQSRGRAALGVGSKFSAAYADVSGSDVPLGW